jgi:hypothetical protein
MSNALVVRALPMFVLLLALGGCPPPSPPVINDFTVVPTNQCATVPVAVSWAADASEGHLAISPPTGETPPSPLPSLGSGGFLFRTSTTDTTYTLSAERGGRTVSQARTVHIVPNPFDDTLELPYNCAEQVWELPGFSDREYGEVITVESFTNLERQPLLLEFGGQTTDLPPGMPTRILSPVRFPGGRWRARLTGGVAPVCGGSGTTGATPPTTPPPVRITVRSTCPTH